MAVTAKKKSKKKSSKSTNLQPLGERLVVSRDASDEQTAGGILLPSSSQEKPLQGTVISVGSGRLLKDGTRHPLTVQPGDRVLFTSYAANEIKMDGEEYLLMSEDDILAIID